METLNLHDVQVDAGTILGESLLVSGMILGFDDDSNIAIDSMKMIKRVSGVCGCGKSCIPFVIVIGVVISNVGSILTTLLSGKLTGE